MVFFCIIVTIIVSTVTQRCAYARAHTLRITFDIHAQEFSTDDLFSTDDDHDLLITKAASPLNLQPSQKEEIKIESFSGLETLGEIITEQVRVIHGV